MTKEIKDCIASNPWLRWDSELELLVDLMLEYGKDKESMAHLANFKINKEEL